MEHLDKLAQLFARFPGIGERQSRRFVYFLLAQNRDYVNDLAQTIENLKQAVQQCPLCLRYSRLGTDGICDTCSNPSVDRSILLVVEKDTDHDVIKKSGLYSGNYFVLGDTIPLIEKRQTRARTAQLEKRVRDLSKDLKEIILAFSLTPDGDHTDEKIREFLAPFKIKISSLGRGLSTGTEIEYSDSETVKYALQNRQ